MKRREKDPKRTAKSIRNWETTMDAYSKATGWHRMNSERWKNAWGDVRNVTNDMENIFPTAKKGNRATADVISPDDRNPRQRKEFKAIVESDSEHSLIGHTLGKGHVVKRRKGYYRPGKKVI